LRQSIIASTHGNTLKHSATHYKTLQHSGKHYSAPATDCNICTKRLRRSIIVTTHCTATHCRTLQRTTKHRNTLQHTAAHCNTVQHTAPPCSKLQHFAPYCNTLQHTVTHCNILQQTYKKIEAKHHYYNTRDVGGWGRDPRKQKDFCTTVKKRPKQKI